jgi:hypothetical protein
MARSRLTGLRSRRSLGPHDFALCRWRTSLWFRRCAYASHLAVISAVDLANGEGRGLGLAHCLEPSSIVSQKALGAGRQVIETTELGHHEPGGKIRLSLRARSLGDTGVGARGHGGPIGLNPAAKRGGKGNWQSNHSNDGAGEFKRKPYELVGF